MPPIAKFAFASIAGGIAIGALAAASVPRTPVEAAPSEWAQGDRGAPVTDGQAAAPDTGALAPIPDSPPQTAYAPMDEAGANANAAPDAADDGAQGSVTQPDDVSPPQDDRAAQAADAARDAADDAKAAEAAPAQAEPDAPQG